MPTIQDTLNNPEQFTTFLSGLFSTITGGPLAGMNTLQAGRKSKEAEGLINKQVSDLGSYFNQQTSTPFIQNPQVASALEQLRAQLQGSMKGNANNAVKTGATAESQVAQQGTANNAYSDALSKLLGFSANRNDQLASNYQYRVSNLYNQLVGLKQGQAQGNADAASQLQQLPTQVLSSFMGNPQGFGSLLSMLKGAGGTTGGTNPSVVQTPTFNPSYFGT